VRGALLLLYVEPLDLRPVDDVRLPLAAETLRPLLDRHPADHPVPVAVLLDRHVVDGALHAGVLDPHLPVQQLTHDERLAGALLEAPQVDDTGGDHLAAVDAGHPGHREEHRASPEHVHHQTEHPGAAAAGPEGRHQVPHPAHLVAGGVEHLQAREAAHEDESGRGAHRDEGSAPDRWTRGCSTAVTTG
jgi:hypothetical protein